MSEGRVSILYQFREMSAALTVTIRTPQGRYIASDDSPYPGFAVLGGFLTWTPPGSSQMVAKLAPQPVDRYNVLWLGASSGNCGNSYGIDTYGLKFLVTGAFVSWTPGSPTTFFFANQGAPAPTTLTLTNTPSFPPS